MFDLFDFWDGRDGLVDGFKVGDLLRCTGLNPTNAVIYANGGTKKLGIVYGSHPCQYASVCVRRREGTKVGRANARPRGHVSRTCHACLSIMLLTSDAWCGRTLERDN